MLHGCVNVAGLYHAGASVLNGGYADIKALGFKCIKIYLTGNYRGDLDGTKTDYPGQSWSAAPYSSVSALAADTGIAAIIGDAQFTDVFLTVATFANGINNPWTVDLASVDLAAEKNEIQALTQYLLTTYSNKNFYLQTWEGDWAFMGAFDQTVVVPPYRAERYAAFLLARQSGVSAGRASVKSTSTVRAIAEVNRVLDQNARRVHRDVLPLLAPQSLPDVVSFSLYECINTWGAGQSDAIANIDSLMRQAVRDVRAAVGTQRQLVIGEYGWPENHAGFIALGLNVGGLIDQVISTGNALGISHGIYWQVYDNASPYTQEALYNPDHSLTGAGVKFQSLNA